MGRICHKSGTKEITINSLNTMLPNDIIMSPKYVCLLCCQMIQIQWICELCRENVSCDLTFIQSPTLTTLLTLLVMCYQHCITSITNNVTLLYSINLFGN